MKTNTKLKIGLIAILAVVLSHTNLSYAADEDAPPSLDFEQPPGLEVEIPDDDDGNPDQPPDEEDGDDGNPDQPPDGDGSGATVKISKVSANPQKFNPSIDNTRISYTISKKAKVEVKILDGAGQTVATLLNNQTLNAGNHNVNWLGTSNNSKSGPAVKKGVYTYKITAKNASTSATEDTKQGQIEIIGGTTGTGNGSGTGTGTQTGNNNQNQATVALNNSRSGTTAETGPGVLIYTLLPAAYFIHRKLKK